MSETKSAETDAVPLSLTIATLKGWPEYAEVFATQRIAVEAVGGEIIVVDGSGKPAPGPDEIGPHTTWISAPGEGVFQLRGRAYAVARGAIIGQSEDHCPFEADWGRVVLALHEEHPEAAVIGGVVENGSPGRVDDWAVFLIGHFRDMPGVGRSRRVAIAGMANVSYKRGALEGLTRYDDGGVNEAAHQRKLAARGEVVLVDDRLRASHVQSQGLAGMITISWHSARTQAAMRRQRMTPMALMRLVAAPVSPIVYAAMIGSAVARQGYARRAFIRSSPMIMGLLGIRAVAEIVGYAAGPGDSARGFP